MYFCEVVMPSFRLSQSPLWEKQRSQYIEFGPTSWTQHGVPFEITSNVRLAKQYAAIAREHMGQEPMTFLELGGGSGKFAYLFLQEMLQEKVRYVLTDLAEKNVVFWKSHPLLQPHFERGALEVKVYDPVRESFRKENSLFVIANYFFDSIEQDLFRVENGQLFEGRVSEELTYSYHPVEAHNYYPEFPELNEVLAEYQKTLSKANFLIPIGAIRTLHHVMPCTLLIGDKGFSTCEEIACWDDPGLVWHGTMSFPVNFHALGAYVRKTGGQMQSPRETNAVFSVHGIGLKGEISPEPEKITADELELMEQNFFPLCREEALLGHDLEHAWERLGQQEKAIAWKKKVQELQVLPGRYQVYATGDVLQIGELSGMSEAIRENKLTSYTAVPEVFPELDAVFDEIFFFGKRSKKSQAPSLLVQSGQTMVRNIEEQFGLKNVIYSDKDLELFFHTHDRTSVVDPNHYAHFFDELERKKQITSAQHAWCLERLAREGIGVTTTREQFEEEDPFFEVLQQCLKKHMKQDSVFKACFPDTTSQFDNEHIFNEIILNPMLDYREELQGNLLWVTVKKANF